MAIYTDLFAIIGSSAAESLRQKIVVGIAIKANLLAKATPTEAQKAWAKDALAHPTNYLPLVLNYIVADYNAATISAITNATDSQVQTAVNAAVDTLLGV